MSDSMETGGFGQNPAIDKINRINTAASRISAVTELEKKVFQPVQPKQKAVLDKRRQLSQDFQINFKKGGNRKWNSSAWRRAKAVHRRASGSFR